MTRRWSRVVKVGGSLFDFDRLAEALPAWLDRQPPGSTIFLAGGGPLVDVVRRWHERFTLDDQQAHWLCIDLMSVTARMLASLLPSVSLESNYASLVGIVNEDVNASAIVFDARQFLQRDESHLPGNVLPRDWTVSSDSIAARLATVLGVDELVLLKSSRPAMATAAGSPEVDFVDPHFSTAASGLRRLRFVNLRDTDFPEVVL